MMASLSDDIWAHDDDDDEHAIARLAMGGIMSRSPPTKKWHEIPECGDLMIITMMMKCDFQILACLVYSMKVSR